MVRLSDGAVFPASERENLQDAVLDDATLLLDH